MWLSDCQLCKKRLFHDLLAAKALKRSTWGHLREIIFFFHSFFPTLPESVISAPTENLGGVGDISTLTAILLNSGVRLAEMVHLGPLFSSWSGVKTPVVRGCHIATMWVQQRKVVFFRKHFEEKCTVCPKMLLFHSAAPCAICSVQFWLCSCPAVWTQQSGVISVHIGALADSSCFLIAHYYSSSKAIN